MPAALGPGAQSLRGLPNGFANSQSIPQSRTISSRFQDGKISASNGATWAFGGGVPMGSAGLPSQRPNNGPMTSFAQTIGGSQPATPLDLSEFPSLSTTSQQQSTTSTPSMWAMPNSRPLGQVASQRAQQQSMLPTQQQTQAQQQAQQQQQDDLFSSSSQLPNSQTGFRFGSQSAVGQISQSQSSGPDDFPPLNRNVNGEIGQDRAPGLLQNVGFGHLAGSPSFGGGGALQSTRSNGLLNAVASNARPPASNTQGPSPSPSLGGISASRSPAETNRQTSNPIEGESGFSRSTQLSISNSLGQSQPSQNQSRPDALASVIAASQQQQHQGNDLRFGPQQGSLDEPSPVVEDPLSGMSDKDRFGLKGLIQILKGTYPDQAALYTGIDVSTLGLEMNSSERLSEMIWSPWDDLPGRPDIPKHTIPDCYQVFNVQPIENKMSSFSDETLMMMFYNNPQDVQQMIAATELTNRNWRYHKKLQLWLTKDDMMVPQPLGANTERGYYIFFDPKQWGRERREYVLTYSDLESVVNGPPGSII